MLAVVLGALTLLTAASVATFRQPAPEQAPWGTANACGPAGALLAYGLVWVFGRAAAFGLPLLAAAWTWNRLRSRPALPLAVMTAIGTLLVFEICSLFALGGLDRWTWAGAWGLCSSTTMAFHSPI